MPSLVDVRAAAGGPSWTIAAISAPRIFARQYRVFADTAREYIRSRPDWRGLRFSRAWVFANQLRRRGFSSLVQLESGEHVAQVQVTLENDGTWTREVVSDRAKEAWER